MSEPTSPIYRIRLPENIQIIPYADHPDAKAKPRAERITEVIVVNYRIEVRQKEQGQRGFFLFHCGRVTSGYFPSLAAAKQLAVEFACQLANLDAEAQDV